MENTTPTRDKQNRPHSHNLRLHRRMDSPGTFFITKGLTPRVEVLCSAPASAGAGKDASNSVPAVPADVILDALKFAVAEKRVMLAAFVVMPDHWHALLGTQPGWLLPKVMRTMDSWIGNRTQNVLTAASTCWQEGYHETRIRSSKQFDFVVNYIEMNPVNKGLVGAREEWLWSSANAQFRSVLTRPWPHVFENDKLG